MGSHHRAGGIVHRTGRLPLSAVDGRISGVVAGGRRGPVVYVFTHLELSVPSSYCLGMSRAVWIGLLAIAWLASESPALILFGALVLWTQLKCGSFFSSQSS